MHRLVRFFSFALQCTAHTANVADWLHAWQASADEGLLVPSRQLAAGHVTVRRAAHIPLQPAAMALRTGARASHSALCRTMLSVSV